MQSSATLCFLGAAAPRRKKIRRPPLKPTDLSIIAEDVNEALVSEHPLGHVSSFANKVVLRPPIPDAGDNPAREPRAPKAPLKLVGMLRPQKKTLAAQERQPQPLQSPFRRNPTRQAQMCQNAQRQNPLHLAPVLDQDLLKRRLEESAAKELADMMNSCRETAYAAMAEEARRKRQCEDDELAKRHAEEAIRHAKRTQNPFADLGGGDAQRPSPPPRRLSNRPGPVLTSRWSRWVPVNNTRGGGNARRRKCGYCNWGVAVVRQRILWQQRYEMLDLCCVCELKRQRGEILLENEKWNVVYESSSSEEGDDVYMSNTDTAPPAAVAPRRRPSQVRQIPAVPIRSLGIQFCSTVWAQNPVRTLMAKAASLNLLGLVRGFVTDQLLQPVAALIADTATQARGNRRASPRRRNSPQPVRPVRASPPVVERPLRVPAVGAARGPSPPRRRSPNVEQENRVRKAAPQFRRYTRNDPRLFFGYLS